MPVVYSSTGCVYRTSLLVGNHVSLVFVFYSRISTPSPPPTVNTAAPAWVRRRRRYNAVCVAHPSCVRRRPHRSAPHHHRSYTSYCAAPLPQPPYTDTNTSSHARTLTHSCRQLVVYAVWAFFVSYRLAFSSLPVFPFYSSHARYVSIDNHAPRHLHIVVTCARSRRARP